MQMADTHLVKQNTIPRTLIRLTLSTSFQQPDTKPRRTGQSDGGFPKILFLPQVKKRPLCFHLKQWSVVITEMVLGSLP